MRRLKIAECPTTRVAFIEKWNADRVFRNRAKAMGFNVAFGCVFFPNGMVANKDVK